jgi:hypothetical protein
MGNYKTLSSFLFEGIKEPPDLESIYQKIEYKELKNFWIPAAESVE